MLAHHTLLRWLAAVAAAMLEATAAAAAKPALNTCMCSQLLCPASCSGCASARCSCKPCQRSAAHIFCAAYRRLSQYGVNFWAAQRLVDQTMASFGGSLVGTWALNAIYRTFGARVGSNAILRKIPAVSVPDLLNLGNKCALSLSICC